MGWGHSRLSEVAPFGISGMVSYWTSIATTDKHHFAPFPRYTDLWSKIAEFSNPLVFGALSALTVLQCLDAVGWASGRASGL